MCPQVCQSPTACLYGIRITSLFRGLYRQTDSILSPQAIYISRWCSLCICHFNIKRFFIFIEHIFGIDYDIGFLSFALAKLE